LDTVASPAGLKKSAFIRRFICGQKFALRFAGQAMSVPFRDTFCQIPEHDGPKHPFSRQFAFVLLKKTFELMKRPFKLSQRTFQLIQKPFKLEQDIVSGAAALSSCHKPKASCDETFLFLRPRRRVAARDGWDSQSVEHSKDANHGHTGCSRPVAGGDFGVWLDEDPH
jgi:hypothetical protein